MSLIKVEMYSNSLERPVMFEMFMPHNFRTDPLAPQNPHYERACKTVFVLHGYTGWGRGWEFMYELGMKYNLALVFPSVENSFYLDSDATAYKYGTFVGLELVEYIRKTFGLCQSKEDTYISGFSMGGFGAIHLGLSYPDTFGKIVALSSALIIHVISGMKPGEKNDIANYDYYHRVFGDLEFVIESDKNPETLIKNLLKEGKDIPPIYMACGTEDFLLETNRQFHQFLTQNNVAVDYTESPGDHNLDFGNVYFEKSFEWMLRI